VSEEKLATIIGSLIPPPEEWYIELVKYQNPPKHPKKPELSEDLRKIKPYRFENDYSILSNELRDDFFDEIEMSDAEQIIGIFMFTNNFFNKIIFKNRVREAKIFIEKWTNYRCKCREINQNQIKIIEKIIEEEWPLTWFDKSRSKGRHIVNHQNEIR
jgi:hypothetical protein